MLTNKQQRFVEEYPADCNPEAAAIRAGFSKASARQAGQRLMKLPEIQAALLRQQMDRERAQAVTKERVLQELASVAFANGADYAGIEDGVVVLKDLASLPGAKRAAIQTIKEGKTGPEIVTYDKLKALELLGKHLGIFDGSQRGSETEGTNLLDVIRAATCREMNLDGLSELSEAEEGKEVRFAV